MDALNFFITNFSFEDFIAFGILSLFIIFLKNNFTIK